eukprot:351571-Chlamydomonas_euryale.AAC.8
MSLRAFERLPALRSAQRVRKKLMRKVLSLPMRVWNWNHAGVSRYLRYGCSTRALASSMTGRYKLGNTWADGGT